MLSEENRAKIVNTGLYRAEPDRKLQSWCDNPYWCKNWTFVVRASNNELYMVDTYFKDNYILLTDDNFDKFSLIFDFNDVCQENCPEEYNENDVYYVSTDSGGMTMVKTYRKKHAKRPVERMVKLMEYEIGSLENQLKSAKKELEMYKDGTHWKLK